MNSITSMSLPEITQRGSSEEARGAKLPHYFLGNEIFIYYLKSGLFITFRYYEVIFTFQCSIIN